MDGKHEAGQSGRMRQSSRKRG